MKKIIKSLAFLLVFTFQFLFAFPQVQDDFYNLNKINDIHITFKVSNWAHILDSLIQVGDGEQRILADLVINGKKFYNAGIRYKGFSSWHANGTKNPFNISLDYLIKIKTTRVIQKSNYLMLSMTLLLSEKYFLMK
jgi:hypothetical protein